MGGADAIHKSDRTGAIPVKAKKLNRALAKLRKRSKKAKAGSDDPKHLHARELWRAVKRSECKTECCDKPQGKWCKKCPRHEGELMRRVLLASGE